MIWNQNYKCENFIIIKLQKQAKINNCLKYIRSKDGQKLNKNVFIILFRPNIYELFEKYDQRSWIKDYFK